MSTACNKTSSIYLMKVKRMLIMLIYPVPGLHQARSPAAQAGVPSAFTLDSLTGRVPQWLFSFEICLFGCLQSCFHRFLPAI